MTRPHDELYLPEAIRLARNFRQLFARTYVKGCWQTCGWVRRQRPSGPRVLRHVVIPAEGDGGPSHSTQARPSRHSTAGRTLDCTGTRERAGVMWHLATILSSTYTVV
jgi:hypothetical protein